MVIKGNLEIPGCFLGIDQQSFALYICFSAQNERFRGGASVRSQLPLNTAVMRRRKALDFSLGSMVTRFSIF